MIRLIIDMDLNKRILISAIIKKKNFLHILSRFYEISNNIIKICLEIKGK